MKTRTLRLPEELDARIERIAEDERRSVNAEIVHLLERATGGHDAHHLRGPATADYREPEDGKIVGSAGWRDR